MSGLCIVLLHPLFKLCFLIISFWSLKAFQAVHLLGNSDLHTCVLGFLGSKFFFDKALKLPLHHRQHEPQMLFWRAGLLWGCNICPSEVSCSRVISRWMDAAPEIFQKQAVELLTWRQQDFCASGFMKQAANSCFEIPLPPLAMFQY